jgi:AcrR family transcriptional regulator
LSNPPPRKSLRERKKQAQRSRIIEEALTLIGQSGIADMTIDAICERAGISRKTFYNYYGTRHDLLFDICVSRTLELVRGSVDEALERFNHLDERITHVLGAQKQQLCQASDLEHELARYSIASIGNSLASGATLLSVMNENFLRLYSASTGDLKDSLSAEFCAEMTVGMIDTVILNHLHNPDYDAGKRYDELIDFLCHSLVRERARLRVSSAAQG